MSPQDLPLASWTGASGHCPSGPHPASPSPAFETITGKTAPRNSALFLLSPCSPRSLPLFPHLPREECGWPVRSLPLRRSGFCSTQNVLASASLPLRSVLPLGSSSPGTPVNRHRIRVRFLFPSILQTSEYQKTKTKNLCQHRPRPQGFETIGKLHISMASARALHRFGRRKASQTSCTDLKRRGSHADTSRTPRLCHGASVSSQKGDVTPVLGGHELPSLHLITAPSCLALTKL